MGIFGRFSDIISANISALLDKVENPEHLLAQVIREMEEGLAKAKRLAVTAIAAERRIGRELEQNRVQTEFWKNKAREALSRNREDLARRSLVRKKEHDDLVRSLEMQYAEAGKTSESVRTAVWALEARLAEARRKKRSLVARHRAAEARTQIHRLVGAGFPDWGTSLATFDRLENRLIDFEDHLAAQTDINPVHTGLEIEFAELEREQAITEELETLKRESKG
jgi:phage shock protein A